MILSMNMSDPCVSTGVILVNEWNEIGWVWLSTVREKQQRVLFHSHTTHIIPYFILSMYFLLQWKYRGHYRYSILLKLGLNYTSIANINFI